MNFKIIDKNNHASGRFYQLLSIWYSSNAMKVILMQDVAKIGQKNTIANVPDGYARNQLIPKGLAKPATAENLKKIESLQAKKSAEQDQVVKKFMTAKKALSDNVPTIETKKNDNGHLFAAIKTKDVAEALKNFSVDVDESMIKLTSPIKEAGEHTVDMRCGEHKFTFTIKII